MLEIASAHSKLKILKIKNIVQKLTPGDYKLTPLDESSLLNQKLTLKRSHDVK